MTRTFDADLFEVAMELARTERGHHGAGGGYAAQESQPEPAARDDSRATDLQTTGQLFAQVER